MTEQADGKMTYVDRCLQRLEAPLKSSFRRQMDERLVYREEGDGEGKDCVVLEEKVVKGKGSGPGKRKQAKERRSERQSTKNICAHVAKQETCPMGESCKYNHDVDAYLEQKEPDLPGECPFASKDVCPYSITCRWRSWHGKGREDGDVPIDCRAVIMERDGGVVEGWWQQDGSIDAAKEMCGMKASSHVQSPMNGISKDLLSDLRKRTYDFSKADDVLSALSIKNTMKNRDRKDGHAKKRGFGNQGTIEHESKKTCQQSINNDGQLPVEDTSKQAVREGCQETGTTTRRESSKIFDVRGKTYLAPLTTVGNLPFRRLCKSLGADITCGEMAMATNLLQGQISEWALLKRHPEEDCFGVQICGGYGDAMARCAQLIQDHCHVDFVDINFGCPIDVIVNKGAGSACLTRPKRMEEIVRSVSTVLDCPLTVKMRKGYNVGADIAHELIPKLGEWGASAVTLHGRTREQRYSRLADWEYIHTCANVAKTEYPSMSVIGNGDVLSWQQHVAAVEHDDGQPSNVATTYVARGALIKPWIFTEIKERRDWDISASERLDIMKKFVRNGLEHWGSDARGVETCRRFLLEWLSFTHRYIPVGLLEVLPQQSNWRPPAFVGRNDLETLLASPDPRDWIFISEMLLGKAPPGFRFTAKHKANAYANPNGNTEAAKEDQENG